MQEVEELEIRKKQLRNDDEDIKTINSKLAIAQIKWKMADSKRVRNARIEYDINDYHQIPIF